MNDPQRSIGFEWDSGNTVKNEVSHGVTPAEAEQVFFGEPLVVAEDPRHSQHEPRYYALGVTQEGRRLFVAFTIREDRIRVISARDMHRKERAIYEAQGT